MTRLLLTGADAALQSVTLFDAGERAALEDQFASTTATADLVGRARVRKRWEEAVARERQFSEQVTTRQFDEAGTPIPGSIMTPQRALEYFRKLVPSIGVDPQRWGEQLQRHAFTLAVDTEGIVLEKVQRIIAERMESGVGISSAPAVIDEVLEQAGIHPRNPQYAEAVFRTNYMDSVQTGIDEEKADPEVAEFFPVWRYSNPGDSRSRPEHAARNGLYYPASAPFVEVRGTDAGDVINCRCDQILIDKFEWAELESNGSRVQRSW